MPKLLDRYKNLSPTLKASFWFVVCNVIQKATQILTTPIYTRLMPQAKYGEYTVFLSWVEVAAIFTTLDIFYSGYNVGMEKFMDDRARYTSSMHGLCFLLTTVWVIALCPFAASISPYIGISAEQIKMLLLYMYVFPIYQFWSARKKYDYQYKPLILVTAISSVCTIALGTLFAVCFKNKSNGVILAKIIVEAAVSVPLILVSVHGIRNLFNKYYWKYALKFNIPLVPHYLSTMILNHSDRLMIAFLCNAASAAIYSVAYSIAMLMTIVQNAVNSAIVPWMYGKLRKKELDGMAKITTGVIAFVAVLNLLLLMIAPEAIRILSTAEYADAAHVIPPITFGVFLTAVYGMFVNVELYYNYNHFAAAASLVAAISNVVLNYVFIRIYGYIAAGYTTFASYLLLSLMHYWGLRRVAVINQIDLKKIFHTRHLLLVFLFFLGCTIVIYMLYGVPAVRYAILALILIVAALKRKKLIGYAGSFMSK